MSRPHTMVGSDQEPAVQKSHLLPRFGLLGVTTALFGVLRGLLSGLPPVIGKTFLLTFVIVGIVYLAWVILRTRDLVADYSCLSRIDRWLCWWSGPTCTGISVGLFVFAVLAVSVAERTRREPIWVRSNTVLGVIYFIMEISFVLAITCCVCSSKEVHIRPLVLWRVLCLPQAAIYGMYIFCGAVAMVVNGFSGSNGLR